MLRNILYVWINLHSYPHVGYVESEESSEYDGIIFDNEGVWVGGK